MNTVASVRGFLLLVLNSVLEKKAILSTHVWLQNQYDLQALTLGEVRLALIAGNELVDLQ